MNITSAFEEALRSGRLVRRILTSEDQPPGVSKSAENGENGDAGRTILRRRRTVVPKDDFTKEAYRIVGFDASFNRKDASNACLDLLVLQNGYIRELTRFLKAIRGPFLDLSRRLPSGIDSKPATVTFPVILVENGAAAAPRTVTVTSLSNKEKDEIEIELKKYTKICAALIGTLRKEIGVLCLVHVSWRVLLTSKVSTRSLAGLPPSFADFSHDGTRCNSKSPRPTPGAPNRRRVVLGPVAHGGFDPFADLDGTAWPCRHEKARAVSLMTIILSRVGAHFPLLYRLKPRIVPSLTTDQFEQLKPTHSTSLMPPSIANSFLTATPTFSLTRLTNAALGRTARSTSRNRDGADRGRSRSGSRESRSPASAPGSFVKDDNELLASSTSLGPLIKAGSSLESLVRSSESLDEPHIGEMLTPAQKMELERENESMLKELEDNLEQVWQATQSIQDIAQLQSQLAFHLQSQQESIERLHEEAIQQVDTVKSANDQLRSAQRRFGGRRTFVLLFLMVSSSCST